MQFFKSKKIVLKRKETRNISVCLENKKIIEKNRLKNINFVGEKRKSYLSIHWINKIS